MAAASQIVSMRRKLMRWYRDNRRTMPWRAHPGKLADAYRVLVSESMLQQTQVSSVVPFYQRFVDRFGTVAALAETDEQEVLRLWQGLGYYRRARHLHSAAKQIVNQYDGIVPRKIEHLRRLSGVGPYTAGAIASMAFGEREPVVDGNVSRVLARLRGETRPANDSRVTRTAWRVMRIWVNVSVRANYHAGDVNQAIMELGATVCTPRKPSCCRCPLRGDCVAQSRGEPEKYGKKAKREKAIKVTHQVVGLQRNARWLFEQRDDNGLWAGMWQMPTQESHATFPPDGPAALSDWIDNKFGLRIRAITKRASFAHMTTHRAIQFEIFAAELTSGRLKPHRGRWRCLKDVDDLPISSAQRRVIEVFDR